MTTLLKGRAKEGARFSSGVFAAAVTAFLAYAGFTFARQRGKRRYSGLRRAALDAAGDSSPGLRDRGLAFDPACLRYVAGAGVAVCDGRGLIVAVIYLPVDPARLGVPSLILLLVATIMGAPIFVTLGGAGLILLFGDGASIEMMAIKHHGLVTNASWPAIPLFTLAGYFWRKAAPRGAWCVSSRRSSGISAADRQW